MVEKCRFNILIFILPNVFHGCKEGREEEGEKVNMKENPKTGLFGYILKNQHVQLLGAWSLLLVHIWFTPSQGPKDFKHAFF